MTQAEFLRCRENLINYLKDKLEQGDFHATRDAAADLEILEARYVAFREGQLSGEDPQREETRRGPREVPKDARDDKRKGEEDPF